MNVTGWNPDDEEEPFWAGWYGWWGRLHPSCLRWWQWSVTWQPCPDAVYPIIHVGYLTGDEDHSIANVLHLEVRRFITVAIFGYGLDIERGF